MDKNYRYMSANGVGVPTSEEMSQSEIAFDSNHWKADTRLKLCTVPWHKDMKDVVKFEDDTARDAYLEGLAGNSVTLTTPRRILPGQAIALPFSFDSLAQHNYLVATFASSPAGGDTSPTYTTFCYFIDSMQYQAPSVTTCTLILDDWTTFINHVDFSNIFLEQGHAPMSSIKVGDFLSNPVENASMLLAPDVSYGDPVMGRSSTFVPFGSGTKYMLVATTIPISAIDSLGSTDLAVPQDMGYYTEGGRNGHMAGATDIVVGAGGVDYSGCNLETQVAGSADTFVPNSLQVWAVKASDAVEGGFFADMVEQCPQFLQTIKGVYIVDDSMITLSTKHTFLKKHSLTWAEMAATGKTWAELAASGHTYAEMDAYAGDYYGTASGYSIWEVEANNGTIQSLGLTGSQFGYDAKYAGITKLYTYPYSCLEVSDQDGKTVSLRVEDTGSLEVDRRMSIAYPYIRFEAFLVGVQGSGTTAYTWKTLSDASVSDSIPNGSFKECLFAYDIPAFQLYMSGYDAYRLHNYNANNVVGTIQREIDYQNIVRGANTGYENAIDSADTGLTNANASITTSRSNSYASAATGQTNANASALAGYQNTQDANTTGYNNGVRSADTGFGNAQRSALNSQTVVNNSLSNTKANGDNSNLTDYAMNVRSINTTKSNADRSVTTGKANANNMAAAQTTNAGLNVTAQTAMLTKSNAEGSTETSNNNGLMQAQQAYDAGYNRAMAGYQCINQAISSMTSGTLYAAAGGGFSAELGACVQTAADIGFTLAETEAGISNSQYKVTEVQKNNNNNLAARIDASTTNMSTSNTLLTNATANVVNAINTNAGNSYNTGLDNNNAAYGTSSENAVSKRDLTTGILLNDYIVGKTNADLNKDTSVSNAQDTQSTSITNAGASRDTSNSNAQRSYNVAVANNKRSYDTSTGIADATAVTGRLNAQRTNTVTIDNAEYSRDTTISNAQRSIEGYAKVQRAGYLDRRLDMPIAIGTASGDPVPDAMHWRGIQVKVKTQRAGAIAQAGDHMLRFGYALNRFWVYTRLNLMKHFTYWKCNDIYVLGETGVLESSMMSIKEGMMNGVTVWSDPTEIGKVSIYDN